MTARPSVLISGASRGLGHELNRLYLERGWTTFLLIRDASIAAHLAQLSAGRCYPVVADLSRDDALGKIARSVSQRTDRLDPLINNAGIRGRSYTVDEVWPAEVVELLQVHCLGVIRCTKAVLPLLRAAERAKVVDITSRLGSMTRNASGEFAGQGFSYSYRIAKAAQNMFTRLPVSLVQELQICNRREAPVSLDRERNKLVPIRRWQQACKHPPQLGNCRDRPMLRGKSHARSLHSHRDQAHS